MNALIAIVADFFEHVADPSFGREANDSYALKFYTLMDNDAETARWLAAAPLNRDDVGSMSAAAWLWYLAWRESITNERPSIDFLDALYEETVNPILRLRIVEVGARGIQSDQADGGTIADSELQNTEFNWVRNRIRNIIGNRGLGIQDEDFERARAEDTWELLSYLIDINSSDSLEAARMLLTESWPGAGALRERTLGLVAQMQLPNDVDRQLRAQLGLLS